jgi:hypothetical protein
VTDPIAWIREQLDEDERKAREATPGPWRWTDPGLKKTKLALVGDRDSTVLLAASADAFPAAGDAAHIANWDPSRALAEVESTRRLLDMYESIAAKKAENSARYARLMAVPELDQEAITAAATHGWELTGRLQGLEFAVQVRALPYAGRPGFPEQWRP